MNILFFSERYFLYFYSRDFLLTFICVLQISRIPSAGKTYLMFESKGYVAVLILCQVRIIANLVSVNALERFIWWPVLCQHSFSCEQLSFSRWRILECLPLTLAFCGFVHLCLLPLGLCSWALGCKVLSFASEAPAKCQVDSGLKQS